jgi:hypothetical protein
MSSHEGAKPCSKQEVDFNSDILTLEISGEPPRNASQGKALLQIFRAAKGQPLGGKKKQGMCHTCGLAIYIFKVSFEGKRRRIMETQIFHHAEI